MADKTESKQEVSREEAAAYLREVADELESGDEMNVAVGNKSVTLSPPDQVKSEVEVVERSSKLRGNRESIAISMNWKAR